RLSRKKWRTGAGPVPGFRDSRGGAWAAACAAGPVLLDISCLSWRAPLPASERHRSFDSGWAPQIQPRQKRVVCHFVAKPPPQPSPIKGEGKFRFLFRLRRSHLIPVLSPIKGEGNPASLPLVGEG